MPPAWRLDSGHVSLDLVNTRQRRWGDGVEQLATPADLADWLRQAGLVAEPPEVTATALADARSLRESIDALVAATVADRPAPRTAVAELNAWIDRPGGADAPRLRLDDAGQPLLVEPEGARPGVETMLRAVAVAAAQLLGTEERGRLRVCGDETCSVRFLDRSNARAGRWCSARCCTRHHMRARRRRAAL